MTCKKDFHHTWFLRLYSVLSPLLTSPFQYEYHIPCPAFPCPVFHFCNYYLWTSAILSIYLSCWSFFWHPGIFHYFLLLLLWQLCFPVSHLVTLVHHTFYCQIKDTCFKFFQSAQHPKVILCHRSCCWSRLWLLNKFRIGVRSPYFPSSRWSFSSLSYTTTKELKIISKHWTVLSSISESGSTNLENILSLLMNSGKSPAWHFTNKKESLAQSLREDNIIW